MEISGRILREVEFRDRLRGYDTDEVDEFLEKVAAGVDELVAELEAAREKLTRRTDPGLDDESLRRTLVLAQRTADLAVREARDEAAALIEDARLEATALTAEARDESGRLRTEAERDAHARIVALESRRVELEKQVAELEQLATAERERLSAALSAALESLGGAPVATREPERALTVPVEEPDEPVESAEHDGAVESNVEDEDTAETPQVGRTRSDERPRHRSIATQLGLGDAEFDDDSDDPDEEHVDKPRRPDTRMLRAVESTDADPDEALWQRWARGADLDAVPKDRDPSDRPLNRTERRGGGWTA